MAYGIEPSLGRVFFASGARWPTAAVPMKNPYCSCKLTLRAAPALGRHATCWPRRLSRSSGVRRACRRNSAAACHSTLTSCRARSQPTRCGLGCADNRTGNLSDHGDGCLVTASGTATLLSHREAASAAAGTALLREPAPDRGHASRRLTPARPPACGAVRCALPPALPPALPHSVWASPAMPFSLPPSRKRCGGVQNAQALAESGNVSQCSTMSRNVPQCHATRT